VAPVGTTRFQRSQRLCRPAQFQAAYAQGRRFGNELFTATVRVNEGHASARLGLSIAARSVGNSVNRNRLRRQVRESFRLQQGLPPVDIVIGARNGARRAPAKELREALERLWKQINEAWAQRSSKA
jgi:ribonuclease P protein component